MKNSFLSFLKLLTTFVVMSVIAMLVLTFSMYVLVILGVIVVIFSIAWVCNIKFVITEDGVPVGTYKRSTGFVAKTSQKETV
ncbi:MAG: hypothetical protein CO120_09800 [Gammaproteobacteria bacterium CG_4_9_14_3_um_filter_38_9]|nr:MAG: hypothetical protein CO120_09800 [Gammaproteobacteria bacterium CG_4_9_14_3_um_filter_38_9]